MSTKLRKVGGTSGKRKIIRSTAGHFISVRGRHTTPCLQRDARLVANLMQWLSPAASRAASFAMSQKYRWPSEPSSVHGQRWRPSSLHLELAAQAFQWSGGGRFLFISFPHFRCQKGALTTLKLTWNIGWSHFHVALNYLWPWHESLTISVHSFGTGSIVCASYIRRLALWSFRPQVVI